MILPYIVNPFKGFDLPYSVVEGGVQITLYVLILALIGGNLRYLYNIAKTQLKKHTKEPNAEEKKIILNKLSFSAQ
jgi:hypothetical protein